jgi:RNA recognition motif-containing protein
MGSRLYVGNLSFNSDTESVRQAFSEIGEVTDVHIVMDRETGRSRGFAFVTMASDQLASEAISRLDGATLDGRALRVNEAEERKGGGGGGRSFGGGGGGGYGGGGGGGGGRRGGGGGGRDRDRDRDRW